jgi:hypothetical protein
MNENKETELKEKFENQLNFTNESTSLIFDQAKAEEFKEKGNEAFKSKSLENGCSHIKF